MMLAPSFQKQINLQLKIKYSCSILLAARIVRESLPNEKDIPFEV